MSQRFPASAVFGWLFLLSGASALGCQVVWARVLGAAIGQELPATLGVVTGYMAGLGLGARLGGWLVRSGRDPARLYAWVEIWLAVWVVASIWILRPGAELLTGMAGVGVGPVVYWLVSFFAAGLLLLPGTIGMGSTLVLAERGLAGRLGAPDQAGRLYAWNTAGGVLGVVLASFWLAPKLGFARSLACLAALNLVAGLWAWRFGTVQRTMPGAGLAAGGERKGAGRGLAWAGFLSGFWALGYEAVGFRLLGRHLDNTIHTFATVLGLFLVGTAVGAWGQQRIRRWGAPGFALGTALGMCVSVLGFRALGPTLEGGGMGSGLADLAGGTVLFLLPCLGMGALFARLSREAAESRGGLAGLLWMNSLGCAAGPVVFGAFSVGWLGYGATLAILGAGYAGIAMVVEPGRWMRHGMAAGLAGVLLVAGGAGLGRHPAREGETVVFERTGLMAGVAVVQGADGHRVLRVNNRFQMGGTAAAIAEQRHADIPLLLHPYPRSLLMLGLGTGISMSAAAHHPGLRAVGIELVPEVLEAAGWFVERPGAGDGWRTVASDARRFARMTGERFDVVVGDLFHPAVDGAGFLYTVEHFRAVRGVLAEGGVFCQWLPLFQMGEPVARSVTRSFLEVFPEGELWMLRPSVDLPVVGLIGWTRRPVFDAEWVERRSRGSEVLAAHLRAVGLGDSLRLFGLYMAGPAGLGLWSRGAAANTDDHPVVIFEAPRHLGALRANRQGSFSALRRLLPTVRDWGWAGDFGGALERYARARETYLDGALLEWNGDLAGAVELYLRSAGESAEFTTAYARVLTLATGVAGSNTGLAREWLERLAKAQPGRGVALELLRRLEAGEGAPAR